VFGYRNKMEYSFALFGATRGPVLDSIAPGLDEVLGLERCHIHDRSRQCDRNTILGVGTGERLERTTKATAKGICAIWSFARAATRNRRLVQLVTNDGSGRTASG